MAAKSNPSPDPPPEPWYRSSAAVGTAGIAGLALVGALVYTVVSMSDQWSSPSTTPVMTTVPTTAQTLRSTEPFIATPSYETTTTFPTSANLSTTDIGVPDEPADDNPEESTSETSPSESPTTTRTPRSSRTADDEDQDDATTTSRNRPRLNQTRTLNP